MSRFSILVFLSLALLSSFAFAEEPDFIFCRNKKTVRTIRIENKSAECMVIYTKAGQDRDVGGGKNQNSCEKIADNIQENLKKAGWQCRKVASVGLTESN